MNAYVAVTDKQWFDHLRALSHREPVEEVNFWTPKPWGGQFGVLRRGQPLLFKLKRPHNAIAGGGFFEHYTELPISLAWDAFGEKNGAESLDDVRNRIARLRKDAPRPWEDYRIGCILLAEPFFWDKENWCPQPRDWPPPVQRGKTYDLTATIGKELWREVSDRLLGMRVAEASAGKLPGGYSSSTVRRRVGQGIFQSRVMDAYERQCAVTRERALPALDAAHIKPFSLTQENHIRNGILLRSDVHRLFDTGYMTVTPAYHVEVSEHVRTDFNDGDNYFKLHGERIWVPVNQEDRPGRGYLQWHNENQFRK